MKTATALEAAELPIANRPPSESLTTTTANPKGN